MRTLALLPLVAMALLGRPAPASAQFIDEKTDNQSRLEKPETVRLQMGVVVRSTGSPLKGVYATVPIPLAWEEQKVRIVKEDRSPEVRGLDYRTVGETMRQMVVT